MTQPPEQPARLAAAGEPSAAVPAERVYELLAHLVASAEICVVEPRYYGSFRLLDAAASLAALMSTRRVVRDFSPEPVEDPQLWMILEAGRWATCASNNRVHRLLVVRDAARIKLVADMSPGIFSHPAAMVVICTDLHAV